MHFSFTRRSKTTTRPRSDSSARLLLDTVEGVASTGTAVSWVLPKVARISALACKIEVKSTQLLEQATQQPPLSFLHTQQRLRAARQSVRIKFTVTHDSNNDCEHCHLLPLLPPQPPPHARQHLPRATKDNTSFKFESAAPRQKSEGCPTAAAHRERSLIRSACSSQHLSLRMAD